MPARAPRPAPTLSHKASDVGLPSSDEPRAPRIKRIVAIPRTTLPTRTSSLESSFELIRLLYQGCPARHLQPRDRLSLLLLEWPRLTSRLNYNGRFVARLSQPSALKATNAPQLTSRKSAGQHAKSTNESPRVEGSGDGRSRKFRDFLGGS